MRSSRNNYDHIEYLAYHDTLTNLPNKLAFLDYVIMRCFLHLRITNPMPYTLSILTISRP